MTLCAASYPKAAGGLPVRPCRPHGQQPRIKKETKKCFDVDWSAYILLTKMTCVVVVVADRPPVESGVKRPLPAAHRPQPLIYFVKYDTFESIQKVRKEVKRTACVEPSLMRPHPHGVLPLGNQYLLPPDEAARAVRARTLGLGPYFSTLPDALLLRVLAGDGDDAVDGSGGGGGVGAEGLASLACTSRIMRAFACHEDMWKAATLDAFGGAFKFTGESWRETYGAAVTAQRSEGRGGGDDGRDADRRDGSASATTSRPGRSEGEDGERGCGEGGDDVDDGFGPARTTGGAGGGSVGGVRHRSEVGASDGSDGRRDVLVSASDEGRASPPPAVFSDVLHYRHMGAHLPLDPDWLSVDTIPRRHHSTLSTEAFVEEFEAANVPVVIAGACAHWPAVSDEKWSRDALTREHGDVAFTVGGYEMRLDDFWGYCDRSRDDLPLYLFDKGFAAKAPQLAKDYDVPGYFRDDLFSLLGEASRPDYRWLIVGPARSGSSFHKDPNATSAWNAVVRGRKKWILFHPSSPPPGVHPSADGSTVVQPVTLIEWYMNFYEHVYEEDEHEESSEGEEDDEKEDGKPPRKRGEAAVGGARLDKGDGHKSLRVMEGVCGPGDVLFVPSGWWHMALNLDECLAVTQNFCSPRTLPRVLRFLKAAEGAGSKLCSELISGTSRDARGSLYDRFAQALRKERPEELESAERHLRKRPTEHDGERYVGAGAACNRNAGEVGGKRKNMMTEETEGVTGAGGGTKDATAQNGGGGGDGKRLARVFGGKGGGDTAASLAEAFKTGESISFSLADLLNNR